MTIPDAILIQFNLLMMSMTLLETCRSKVPCRPAYGAVTYREWLYQMLN